MAGEAGNETDPLEDSLLKDPFSQSLFHCLRRMQAEYPDKPYIGDARRPVEEQFRLRQRVSLNFAPSHIAGAYRDELSERLVIDVFGPGLAGAEGPMPIPLSEFIIRRKRDFKGDETLARFLDIFNHRFLSLLFKAWALTNKAVEVERGERSRFIRHFSSLAGIGLDSLRNRDSVADFAKLYFSGHLARIPRNSQGLESILNAYFQMPVRVQEFEGQWLSLPEDTRCKLGDSPETGIMGQSLVIGSKIWECQLKFKIVIGPLDQKQLMRLLPNGNAFRKLKDWIRYYVQDPLAWDLQIIVKKESVPRTQLGASTFLGWTSWMLSGEAVEDRRDLILKGEE